MFLIQFVEKSNFLTWLSSDFLFFRCQCHLFPHFKNIKKTKCIQVIYLTYDRVSLINALSLVYGHRCGRDRGLSSTRFKVLLFFLFTLAQGCAPSPIEACHKRWRQVLELFDQFHDCGHALNLRGRAVIECASDLKLFSLQNKAADHVCRPY